MQMLLKAMNYLLCIVVERRGRYVGFVSGSDDTYDVYREDRMT